MQQVVSSEAITTHKQRSSKMIYQNHTEELIDIAGQAQDDSISFDDLFSLDTDEPETSYIESLLDDF
jgi:hypothetical protein